LLRRKPIAATASIQPQQARTPGKIPIALAAPPPQTSRDFVPWRFSAAGRRSAWLGRHPGGRKPAQFKTHALQKIGDSMAPGHRRDERVVTNMLAAGRPNHPIMDQAIEIK
jgi:hypothetical protein